MGQLPGFTAGTGWLTEDKSERKRWRQGGNKKNGGKGTQRGIYKHSAGGANFS